MGMPGADAIGRLALGQLPSGPPVTLTCGFQQAPTYRKTFLPPRFDSLNINIYTNPVPKNQTDWSKPFRLPLALPQPQIGINPNLFKNPVPFNQTDWAKPFRVPHITPDASRSLNPNLQKNNVPNNQTDWTPARRVPHITPDASRSLNPNLQKNPVPNNQVDWSKPSRVPHITPDASFGLNPNLVPPPVAPMPCNQFDWSPSHRVVAQPQVPVGLNPNLFTNPLPFKGALGSASPLDLRGSPDPSQPYNAALYETNATAPALPFNQYDWSPARRAVAETQVPDGLNPNLFANPVPFSQSDWAKPVRLPHITPDASVAQNPNLPNPVPFNNELPRSRALRGAPDVSPSYNAALYAVTIVAAPFNQTDFATPRRLAGAPPIPDGLNPNLFTNPVPFNQVYWPSSFFPRAFAQPPSGFNPNLDPKPFANQTPALSLQRSLPDDVSQPYNPNLYTVAVAAAPFTQSDWAKPFFPRALQPSADSLNINLFTNPVPVANPAPAAPFAVRALPTPSQVYNPNLYGVVTVSMPLNQFDFAKPFFPRALPLPSDPLNINLFTNPVPFNQADWSKSPVRQTRPDPQAGLNINLFTNPVPFAAVYTGSRRLAPLVPQDQPYNAALYAVNVVANPLPFNQYDAPLAHRTLAAALLSDGLNPNLFRNDMPVGNADWSTPMRLRAVVDPPQPLNLNLFGVFVPPPAQLDFAVTSRPRPSTAPPSVFNPNLSTNDMPFSQFDYPPAHRVPAAPIDLSRGQPNPNIFTNPMPFLQADVGIPRSLPRGPMLDAVNVALLGTPIIIVPLPFNQYDWAPARKQQPQRQQDQLNPTLIASFVPPPPDPEQHSKPFFVTPGRLMNI